MRARPLSMTTRTPSIVSDVSATFVDDDGPALLVMGERGVLFRRRQFAVERQDDKAIAHPRGPDGGDGAPDLVFARHEDEHVAFGVRRDALELIRGEIPNRDSRRRRPVSEDTRFRPETRGRSKSGRRRARDIFGAGRRRASRT